MGWGDVGMGRFAEIIRNVWRRSMVHRAMLVAPPIALILWAGAISVGSRSSAQFFTAKVEKGDISQVVQATGTINPVTTVTVGSVVSGNVVSINVDFNSKVKKGDVIAQIDPVPFQNQLAAAEADYQNSQANVNSLEAQIETSRANVLNMKANIAKAQAALGDAQTQLRRIKELADQGVVAVQQKDTAQATYDGALAGLHAAQAQEVQSEAQLKTTIAQRDQSKAMVMMKKSAVDSARLQLNYCTIRAPIDGTVISRNVDVGQSVAASLQAPNLFSIGQDLTHMLVYTNTDEADVGRIQVGAQASFRVDTFPRETFYGHVSQVRMNATTIQNVVTYNTTIEFDNPDVRLFPGMTAYVSIPVAWANNVIKIPNGALRFKPDLTDSERKTLFAKYDIKENAGKTLPTGGQPAAGAPSGAADAAGRQSAAGGAAPAGGTGGARGGQAGPGQGAGQVSGQGRVPRGTGAAGGAAGTAQSGQNGEAGKLAGSQRTDSTIVWKLNPDKTLEPVSVKLGVTDFTFTAMLEGKLSPGDDLVIGQSTTKAAAAQTSARSPVGAPGGVSGVPRRF
jgi:HlyD family secretion protein